MQQKIIDDADSHEKIERQLQDLYFEMYLCEDSHCKLFKINVNNGSGKLRGHGGINKGILFVAQNPAINRKGDSKHDFVFGNVKKSINDKLFVEMLSHINLNREDVYVTNIVKCSSERNIIKPEYVKMCKKFLLQEIEIIRPRIIIPVGRIAIEFFNAKYNKMTQWNGIDVYGIHHPAFCLRGGISRDEYKSNFMKLPL